MADHELSVDKAIFEAHFAVKMGELIVTGNFGGICSVIKLHVFPLIASQKVNASRTAADKLGRMQSERGNIMIDVNHTESDNADAVFNAQ